MCAVGIDAVGSFRHGLARETATDEVDLGQPGGVELLDVAKALNVRPVSLEDGSADRINLDLPGAVEPGPVKSEV